MTVPSCKITSIHNMLDFLKGYFTKTTKFIKKKKKAHRKPMDPQTYQQLIIPQIPIFEDIPNSRFLGFFPTCFASPLGTPVTP